MSHLQIQNDGSLRLVADRRIFPRAIVKQAAALTVDECHVLLDLDENGSTVVTLVALDGNSDALETAAGRFGNLLISELVRRKLDAQALSSRNLLLARALDGALPAAKKSEADELEVSSQSRSSG